MDIRLSPSVLKGNIEIPASKSCTHRALISSALCRNGKSVISGISWSKDIQATVQAMESLGAGFERIDGNTLSVSGINKEIQKALIDCNESGSTLRFVMPVASALGIDSEFKGRGRLPQRPIDIYKRELSKHGIKFLSEEMPYITSGKLTGGRYEIEGNVSSQFITGLLFALPLLEEDSEIVLLSHLESKPYADITIDILKRFGIVVKETEKGYSIKGGQTYIPHDEKIEGDYSQAGFFYTANAINSDVSIGNLNPESVQGDRQITEIIKNSCSDGVFQGFEADCSDIPDLVPILAVLGTYGKKQSVIYNAERLRIKESDRLVSTAEMINNIGGNVTVTDDGLIINPCELRGGTVDSYGDHRIVMASAIAVLGCKGDVIVKGAEAVEKSYPDFFKDYTNLGGKANVINME